MTVKRTLSKVAQVKDVSLSVPTDTFKDSPTVTDHSEYFISGKFESEAGPVDISLARIKFESQEGSGDGAPPEAVTVALIKYLEYLNFNRPDKRYGLALQSLNASLDRLASGE